MRSPTANHPVSPLVWFPPSPKPFTSNLRYRDRDGTQCDSAATLTVGNPGPLLPLRSLLGLSNSLCPCLVVVGEPAGRGEGGDHCLFLEVQPSIAKHFHYLHLDPPSLFSSLSRDGWLAFLPFTVNVQ